MDCFTSLQWITTASLVVRMQHAKSQVLYCFSPPSHLNISLKGHELAAFNELVACQVNQLHVPLISLFTYGGHRVIVTCILPIDEYTLHFGSADGGRTIKGLPFEEDVDAALRRPLPLGSRSCTLHTKVISELLFKMCKKLNLKPHGGIERSSMPPAVKLMFGPTDMEVHRGRDGRYYIIGTLFFFSQSFCFSPLLSLISLLLT